MPRDMLTAVAEHWNQSPCGSQHAASAKYSLSYFRQIEEYRYRAEPELFSFAQFTRYRGWRVLEIGVGIGTDFMQWARAGCRATGLDLTEDGVRHVKRWLELESLDGEVGRANAEWLPFDDGSFDLVYSWGVLHHAPDTAKCIREAVRVARPGGTCKIMLYHRCSLTALYVWIKWALLRGRPWKSATWCFANCVESRGTKAFTTKEIQLMLSGLPVQNLRMCPILTRQDRLADRKGLPRLVGLALSRITGERCGFYMTIEFVKR